MLKILPLLIPIIFLLFPIITRVYLRSLFIKKRDKKNDLMISCEACGTFTHESLVIKGAIKTIAKGTVKSWAIEINDQSRINYITKILAYLCQNYYK